MFKKRIVIPEMKISSNINYVIGKQKKVGSVNDIKEMKRINIRQAKLEVWIDIRFEW